MSQTKKPVVKKTVSNKTVVATKKNSIVTKKNLSKNKTIPAVKKNPPGKIITPSMPDKKINNIVLPNISPTIREQEMINEINTLRLHPSSYCTYVEAYLQKFNADEEAKVAAKELVMILKKMKSLGVLTLDAGMYNDAKQYGLRMAENNVFEHSTLPYYENLTLGHKDIREAIVDLLIDDGIPSRQHRNNLLNEKIKQVAVFEVPGKVKGIGYCYIQEFK